MTKLGDWYWEDLDTTGSTNDAGIRLSQHPVAKKMVVSAKEQTAGRGRRGRSWLGLPGNLFMSLVVPGSYQDLNHMPFVVSLSLLKVIKGLAPDLDIKLKWPNDVLVAGGKISGILLEKPENEYIVLGIGVNIAAAPKNEQELLYPVAGLRDYGIEIDRCRFLELYLKEFDKTMLALRSAGFEAIRKEWLANAANLGQEIKVNLEHESFQGIFKGLDENGGLLVEKDGRVEKIYAGDVFITKEKRS